MLQRRLADPCASSFRAFLPKAELDLHHEIETNKECFLGFPFSKYASGCASSSVPLVPTPQPQSGSTFWTSSSLLDEYQRLSNR